MLRTVETHTREEQRSRFGDLVQNQRSRPLPPAPPIHRSQPQPRVAPNPPPIPLARSENPARRRPVDSCESATPCVIPVPPPRRSQNRRVEQPCRDRTAIRCRETSPSNSPLFISVPHPSGASSWNGRTVIYSGDSDNSNIGIVFRAAITLASFLLAAAIIGVITAVFIAAPMGIILAVTAVAITAATILTVAAVLEIKRRCKPVISST